MLAGLKTAWNKNATNLEGQEGVGVLESLEEQQRSSVGPLSSYVSPEKGEKWAKNMYPAVTTTC